MSIRCQLNQEQICALIAPKAIGTPFHEPWTRFQSYLGPGSVGLIWRDGGDPANLASIWAVRYQSAQKRGWETGGMPETIAALRECGDHVWICVIESEPYYGLACFTADYEVLRGFLYWNREDDSPAPGDPAVELPLR